jgi:phosphohistidine phosphatase
MESELPGKTLVLVRHAKSSWDHDVEDHERPLSGRGRRDAEALGRRLAEEGLQPDLVLCSDAARTRETWDRAAAGGATAAQVRYVREVYHGWVPELVALIRKVPTDVRTLLMLGHAPGIPDLVDHLCARTDSADWAKLDNKYPTSGLAQIHVPRSWAELGKARAQLVSFTVPRG